MKAQITARLATLDARAVAAILAALVLFVALESWLLVLRAPLTEWRSVVAQRENAESAQTPGALQAELVRTRQAVADTEQTLKAMALPRSDDDMVLHLIATLDQSARRHGVQLGQVRSTARRLEPQVQIATFEGQAQGSYLPLIEWLSEAETRIAPLKTTELKLHVSDEGRVVTMQLKFTAYLPIPEASAHP